MWAYSRILFIHNNVWKLHVVSDIDLAVAIYISYDDRFIITLDDYLASRNVGVLIAGLCGVDGDFVGLGQGELWIIIILCVFDYHFGYELNALCFAT